MLELKLHPVPLIETKRLTLRSISENYLQDIFQLRSNVHAMKYIHRPIATSLEDAKALLAKITAMNANNEGIQWGILLKNQPKVIGMIGYHRIDKEHYRAEIGYMLDPEYWNCGITSEATKAVVDFGFQQMKLHSIEAKINPENVNSEKLLLKNNFIKEAHFKEDFFFNGEFSDTIVYSRLTPLRTPKS